MTLQGADQLEEIFDESEFGVTPQELMYVSLFQDGREKEKENRRSLVLVSLSGISGFALIILGASLIMVDEHIATYGHEILSAAGRTIGTMGGLLLLGSMSPCLAQALK